jgi:hypothetical protein
MKPHLLFFAMLVAAAGASTAGAQVYRCGDTYSQQPCPGGTKVDVDDKRSADQRAQASEAAKRDAKSADAMEKARVKEEAKPAPVGMPPVKAAPAPEDRKPSTAKPKKPDQFTAVAPGAKDTKTKPKKPKKPKKAASAT